MISFRSTLFIIGISLAGITLASCGGGGSGGSDSDVDSGSGSDVEKETGITESAAAPLPSTNQTACYDESGGSISCAGTGQDGDFKSGISIPTPRFTDNNDGTVTDNLTGLIWLQDANCYQGYSWSNALTYSNNLEDGECDLNDGSSKGEWRLPNIYELTSLVNWAYYDPMISNAAGTGKLSNGDPFYNVQTGGRYWSSTSQVVDTHKARTLGFWKGNFNTDSKTDSNYFWPVRN